MRFELTVALKYLIPKWRQLSVSVISLISILVISLVVWLVVLFLSVTEGIEKKWTKELVALNGPVRMVPTEEYYNSYYYLIDSVSSASNYTSKTVGEKLISSTDPYDPDFDQELEPHFPKPELKKDGTPLDPVKEAYLAAMSLEHRYKGLLAQEFEVNFGNLRLYVEQPTADAEQTKQAVYNQVSYVASHDGKNAHVNQMVLAPRKEDILHLQAALSALGSPLEPEQLSAYHAAQKAAALPTTASALGDGLLISKHFQKNGVHLGDRGHLSYYGLSGSSYQEMRLPVYVAGFYDPGVIPVGNKLLFASPELSSLLRTPSPVADAMLGNGITIWLDNLNDAEHLKNDLITALKNNGVSHYWDVSSFHDYEFIRPILEQLRSDKNLFTLIAIIILVVACSNIISMLILLVNDKKKEIGILQAMGASPIRIASIFGLCGFTTGLASSLIGIVAAIITLKNLQPLITLLSKMQGHDAFQQAFYGTTLPNELSYSVLIMTALATLFISLLAGIIPAIKASKIHPTAILKVES